MNETTKPRRHKGLTKVRPQRRSKRTEVIKSEKRGRRFHPMDLVCRDFRSALSAPAS